MSLLNEDLDDSALFCKSLIQKRKASSNINPKNPKQLKLNFSIKTPKDNQLNDRLDNKSIGEESHNCNGNSVLSGYFQPKGTLNICPLCTKSFKTDSAYSTHMKQCAKSHKMTTKQLLGALELQKRKMQWGRDSASSSQHVPTTRKNASKKKEETERDSYDLALGLALSKSLSNHESRHEATSQIQKPTLKEFGITSNHISESLGKKKKEGSKRSTLRTRTVEDRQRILIEKLGVILLDEEQELMSGRPKQSLNSSFHSEQLASLVNVDQQLWNLGENDDKLDRYVDGIRTSMLLNEGNDKGKKESVPSSDLTREISKLQLPQNVHSSWKKMINNSEFSDVTGRTRDCQNFYLHSLVLFARFPEILQRDYESVFQNFNLSTVLIFFEYLYCGTLNTLIKEEIQNLHDLAVEFKYVDLIKVLICLENNLSKYRKSLSPSLESGEIEGKNLGKAEAESKMPEFFERDLFTEENVVDLTQSSNEYNPDGNNGDTSDTESYTEKCYRNFLQREKELEVEDTKLRGEKQMKEMQASVASTIEEEKVAHLNGELPVEKVQPRRESDDSVTRDLDDEFQTRTNARRGSDCIILSSSPESHESLIKENLEKSPPSRTPTPIDNYEIPYFDPYDNFHCFSEEQFSPVGVHSQSLITGDIPSEPLRSPKVVSESPKESASGLQEEPKKNSEYCSTPVTMRPSLRIKSSTKGKLERSRKRRSDLSASRILRKSLGLELKMRNKRSNEFQRRSSTKKENLKKKDLAEVVTDSILNELSKSVTMKSSTPVRVRNFVEITPIPGREEFGESVTPSPNYNNMEEQLLKEHLSKYGLKKNLGKNKARKILRHIYEELHPLYNTETGKIVKILPANTPKARKKAKPRGKPKNVKPEQDADCRPKKSKDKELNSSKESGSLSDGSSETLEGAKDYDTDGNDFENLSETLTQTAPGNPVDLPSAFVEYLGNNPEYHQKILSYEPIWLEELQKKLKENFKKHFKLSDLMDYLDQKCITFRSAAQVKQAKKKIEKQKLRKKKPQC